MTMLTSRALPPLLAVVVLAAGCSLPAVTASEAASSNRPSSQKIPTGWSRLPEAPVSARSDVATAWTGEEALFLGGYSGPPCGAGGAGGDVCSVNEEYVERDGAAFNPTTLMWRRTAAAPSTIYAGFAPAVLGDRVFLIGEKGLLEYDADRDRWQTHSMPHDSGRSLIATDKAVIVLSDSNENEASPDYLYTPTANTWTRLPEDPLGPALRRGVWTPHGLLLSACDASTVNPDDAGWPHPLQAALLEPDLRTWRTLPTFAQASGGALSWTGKRVIDVAYGTSTPRPDTGTGQPLPNGGALTLPAGKWSALPQPPPSGDKGAVWRINAIGGPLVSWAGLLYDDRSGSWSTLEPPAEASDTPGASVWAGGDLLVLGGLDATHDHRIPTMWRFHPRS